jgi:hypothetical protein
MGTLPLQLPPPPVCQIGGAFAVLMKKYMSAPTFFAAMLGKTCCRGVIA